MLKAIKLDPASIKKAMLNVDLKTLPKFVLSELKKLVPTEDELITVKTYEKDYKMLGTGERFIYELSDITSYEKKLNAMYFKAAFVEQADDVEVLIKALRSASDDVLKCDKFKELLKIILALGNYMNPGQRGGAYGFKLASLSKVILAN